MRIKTETVIPVSHKVKDLAPGTTVLNPPDSIIYFLTDKACVSGVFAVSLPDGEFKPLTGDTEVRVLNATLTVTVDDSPIPEHSPAPPARPVYKLSRVPNVSTTYVECPMCHEIGAGPAHLLPITCPKCAAPMTIKGDDE